MKKIFGISLVGVLAAMPMMANAAVTDAVPVAGNADSPTASSTPKYALQGADSRDVNVATAGYVKGAYNAAIKGINAVQDEIVAATSALTSANSALSAVQDTMESDYATQQGVVATVSAATTSGSFSGATVSGTFSSATITGTVTGEATGTIPAMTTWGSNEPGEAPATAALSGTTITGNASGSMTGTASGTTSGTVSVSSYAAS